MALFVLKQYKYCAVFSQNRAIIARFFPKTVQSLHGWGLGSGVWGLGSGVCSRGSGVRGLGLGSGVWSLRFVDWILGSGLRGLASGVWDLESGVQGVLVKACSNLWGQKTVQSLHGTRPGVCTKPGEYYCPWRAH